MKTLFTAQQFDKAVEVAKQASIVKATKSVRGPRTPLGSQVTRNGQVTETCELDMLLITGLALSEGHRITLQQLTEIGKQVGFDLKAARIRSHIKATSVASIKDSVVFLNEDQARRFIQAIQTAWFKRLALLFTPELAKFLEIREDDFVLIGEDAQKKRIAVDHKMALKMNEPKVVLRKKAQVEKK